MNCSISYSDVMLFSNNDIILQSEGGGGKKGQKIAVILNVGHYGKSNFNLSALESTSNLSTQRLK